MTASFNMFKVMVKQISRDMMMLLLILSPFLVGAFFRFGVPAFENSILSRYGYGDVMVPYYELFSWLLAMLNGMMFAFVGGLVVLGEIDEGIAKYIMVTPAGEMGYLVSRIVFPGVLSGIVSAILLPVFALTELNGISILIMSISTVLCGIITAFLVVTISSNKVEGMAVGKISGLFGVTFFAPIFINGAVGYVFSIFPMYYVGMWYKGEATWNLLIALILFVIWFAILYRGFRRKFI